MLLFLTIPLDESDKKLLEDIYCQYRGPMYAAAFSVTHNGADAEDVVQQVFLRLAQKHMPTVQRLTIENTLPYYLLTAARNAAINLYKKAETLHEINVDTNRLDSISREDDSFRGEFDSVDIPFLSEKIRRLNPIYRDVLYQRFVLELSVRDIAQAEHIPLYTVKKRLLRAKQLLRKQCEEANNES